MTLLAASIDGTLFPGDAHAVDQHVATCASCAHVLARLRQQRDSEAAQLTGARSRRSVLAGAITLVVLAGSLTVYGLGHVTSGGAITPSPSEPSAPVRLTAAATADRVSLLLPLRVADMRVAMKAMPKRIRSLGKVRIESPSNQRPAFEVAKVTATTTDAKPVKTIVASGAPDSPGRRHLDAATAAPESAVAPAAEPAHTEPPSTAGLVVRGKSGKPAWRARGGVIEHSVDGGATWADEYMVDHAIVAGAYVAPEVAWLAGADGVILRRTSVGWFEASARADGEVASIRASSPTKASITLVDGRTFETKNAGVAWTEAPTADQHVSADPRRTSAPKKRGTAPRRHSKHARR